VKIEVMTTFACKRASLKVELASGVSKAISMDDINTIKSIKLSKM